MKIRLAIIPTVILCFFTVLSANTVSKKSVNALIAKYEKIYKEYNTDTYKKIASNEIKKIQQIIESAKKNIKSENIEQAYYEISICPHFFKKIQEIEAYQKLQVKYEKIKKEHKTGENKKNNNN